MAEQKYKFQLTCKSKIFGIKTCEMRLETGELLTYMPVPDGVRFCFGTIKRFYESEEGQKIIKKRMANRYRRKHHLHRNRPVATCPLSYSAVQRAVEDSWEAKRNTQSEE